MGDMRRTPSSVAFSIIKSALDFLRGENKSHRLGGVSTPLVLERILNVPVLFPISITLARYSPVLPSITETESSTFNRITLKRYFACLKDNDISSLSVISSSTNSRTLFERSVILVSMS